MPGRDAGRYIMWWRRAAVPAKFTCMRATWYGLLPVGHGGMVRRKINGREILRDIKSGMDDVGLMQKYKLSAKAIPLLMGKLVSKGWLTPEELAARKSLARTAYISTYRCLGRRRISGNEILRDIRSGMDDAGLMKKYDLSPKAILLVMGKLVSTGQLSPEELAARKSLARTVYISTYRCPVCQDIHFTKSKSCPSCGAAMTQLNK
jgi:Mor family transcriptional regulator